MIYFITARDVGRVKIGFSDNPWSRFGKMQSDSPVRLKLERMIEGDVTLEKGFHARFADHRAFGEWFALAAPIEEFMVTLPKPIRAPRETPVKDLVEAVGISPSYASMILSGKQKPSRPLAIHIFRVMGWRHDSIANLTEEHMELLERVEPYSPRTPAPAA
ncbi:Meiotically Up-regulated Gene 113 (MUG113) protein [Sphingomonas sp. PP-CE-3G-477]|uniref:GIY-YIG nuclease family protein n=1 Tax=Sphingomonas sp. PP-CE-3G-477 TaxID=2135660 RepID=UPI000D34ADDD|nr:GIY-YIG nuclease family protein [Sphingomonas sp. PP-CE-3G-477]PTQ64492.1 Meiotically Up-regulated Gene 113 (MUG113) protein [Sphingomonas sp. PP-CE-3G-477]